MNWVGQHFEVSLGNPGHGGFCVARHEGRVVFVRHGLPGEVVRVMVTEDRGGSFCRADAVDIVEGSPDRVPALCPVSGPGGAGCCDFSHATLEAQRAIKAAVVGEQLARLAGIDRDIEVEDVPGTGDGTGWRTRLRLAVDDDGRAGVHGYRSARVIADLRCPQPVSGAIEGIAERQFKPGAELEVAVDSEGVRHVIVLAPAHVSKTGQRSPGRRGAMARRTASSSTRSRRIVVGSGRAVQRVGDRFWGVDAGGFWQAHRGAAQAYSDCVAEWADAQPGNIAWDLYSGAGVFAARLAEQVGVAGSVVAIESSRPAVRDGNAALADLPQVRFVPERVETALAGIESSPSTVVLDPPRAGAGRDVVAAVALRRPPRIVHIGCDPAAFARDVALYKEQGYTLERLRAFDAFPLTHHVEVIGLLTR
ncbi:class I SAM-dependent RNA methyltransferase [Antrihabitans sp. YC2-6]|uniref:class I SAM-dependent RNA methyltransferase n=1 Tax=Antrihabitans sp. YC2-6 TaxID=2799498 RepID=UPI0018F5E456|nr:TRAM domain-containing protein [Antrihabitans sp. YC2-6]MBJ8345079.1 class I SAM-dependent RNA methyltransferase [Antrihabitans sp. YC2-6]